MDTENEVLEEIQVDDKLVEEQQAKLEAEKPKEVQVQEKPQQSSIEKQAGYYSRHPEALDELNKMVGKNKSTDKGEIALNRIAQLEMDNAVKDAVIELGLKKADFNFIKGNSPDELLENARAFAEYKKSLGREKNDEASDEDAQTKAVNKVPDERPFEYPRYSEKVGEKLTLEEEFLRDMPSRITD